MVFNSNEFLVFAGIFFILFFFARGNLKVRNGLVVLGSCVFYAAWDYRFLGLLLLSSLTDFFAGMLIGRSKQVGYRKWVLSLSLGVNLIILGVFKYFDFFRESLEVLLSSFGWDVRWRGLSVVLPMGISFYTFQSMSYSIDVYRGVIRPTSDVVKFLGYVMFFPQLVAGPIERAQDLLPQFARTLTIDAAKLEEGLWLILWGLFKKVALADNFALLVEMVYAGTEPTGPMVLMATADFGLQIYCDFSGYSDIARGLGKLLGFELTANFYLPYFATSLREFWRRWHISLSTCPVFGAVILSVVIHAAGWFGLWPGPQAGLVTDEVFLAHQRQASREPHPADLILTGDSSCSAGVDAPLLESLLPGGERVVNLGLTIGLGMDVYADAVVSFLDSNPGRVKWVILLVTPARLGSESSDEYQRQVWNRLSAESTIGEKGWTDFQSVLGLSALNSRVWPRVWHRPLKGKAAYFYGFGSSFRDYLVAHRGSMVDCAEYAPPIHPQAEAYQLSEFVKEESRRFRSRLPRGIQLAIATSPIPEGQAARSFEMDQRALLLEWNLSLTADCLLTNLPARLPDGMFATGAHLNSRGQRWYTQRLARELQVLTASRVN